MGHFLGHLIKNRDCPGKSSMVGRQTDRYFIIHNTKQLQIIAVQWKATRRNSPSKLVASIYTYNIYEYYGQTDLMNNSLLKTLKTTFTFDVPFHLSLLLQCFNLIFLFSLWHNIAFCCAENILNNNQPYMHKLLVTYWLISTSTVHGWKK